MAVLAPQERLTASEIKRQAAAAGFDLCGIAPATALPELAFLREWLDAGLGGEMEYLRRTAERRSDVRQVMPSARSVIVFGTIYNTDRPYSTEIADPREAAIARQLSQMPACHRMFPHQCVHRGGQDHRL